MNIQHETQIDEPRFEKMKKKAQENKYNLSVYPVYILLGLIFGGIESPKFMSLFSDEPLVTVFVGLYIGAMFVYVWIKGNELNATGKNLTNDFDSICPYISRFNRFELPLKVALYFFMSLLLLFISKNPEIISLNKVVALTLMILFYNPKIKDPMEWKKIDTVKWVN